MQVLGPYLALARTLDAKHFAARHPRPFLLKRGLSAKPGQGHINYETAILKDTADDDISSEVPAEEEWRLYEITKRPGNPFPERISVGRANNCDIVLRFSFISKLHAHFTVGKDGSYSLLDNNSSNGTKHNNVRLMPGTAARVAPGDFVTFGPLRLELVDARSLHKLLLEEDDISIG